MEPTITCGKQLARHCNLAGSRFEDVNLHGAEFENANLGEASFSDINLGGAKFHNVNLGGATIAAANLGGATFKHIGPSLDASGTRPPQEPVRFVEADLNGSVFERVDLRNVKISGCLIDGLTIDGVAIAELLALHRSGPQRERP